MDIPQLILHIADISVHIRIGLLYNRIQNIELFSIILLFPAILNNSYQILIKYVPWIHQFLFQLNHDLLSYLPLQLSNKPINIHVFLSPYISTTLYQLYIFLVQLHIDRNNIIDQYLVQISIQSTFQQLLYLVNLFSIILVVFKQLF